MFMLVTARPTLLLDTVRSRCCQLRFAPLAAGEIAAALVGGTASPSATRGRPRRWRAGVSGGRSDAGGGELAEARAVAAAILMEAARAPTSARGWRSARRC